MRCAWNCSVVACNGVMSSDAYLQGVLNVLRGHTHACAWTHDQVLFRTLRGPALRLLRCVLSIGVPCSSHSSLLCQHHWPSTPSIIPSHHLLLLLLNSPKLDYMIIVWIKYEFIF